MTITPIPALASQTQSAVTTTSGGSFLGALGGALDEIAGSLSRADALASAVALGNNNIAQAAIARAKADVALEVAAVAAGRVTGAIATLMQTQV